MTEESDTIIRPFSQEAMIGAAVAKDGPEMAGNMVVGDGWTVDPDESWVGGSGRK